MTDTLGFFMSVLVAVAFGGLLLPGVALHAFWQAWRELSLARSLWNAELKAFTGRPGPAVAHGKVAWIDPAECPVSIEIEQQGSENDSRGGTTVQWTETDRKTTLQPFEVVLADGRTVRVEPDETTRIADRLEQIEIVSTGVRKKRASFDPGDEVWVVGAMRPGGPGASGPGSAYRGAVKSAPGQERRPLVMRRTPLSPMLLSSIRLGADRTKPGLYHLLMGIVFTLAIVSFHHFYLGSFWGSWLDGTTVEAHDVGRRIEDEWLRGKNGTLHAKHHYFVEFEYADPGPGHAPRRTEIEVSRELHDAVGGGYKTVLRVREGGTAGQQFIGPTPRAPASALYFGLTSVLFIVGYWAGGRAVRPWYERGRLDENEEGKLPIFLRPPPVETLPDRPRAISAPPVDMSLPDHEAERDAQASEEADRAAGRRPR